ncbi:MAG: FAD-dependent oxidoreductase [Spirochaetes bacterium]|nr:FAD-dependent oxidoreductase [Spirochaetota bacterium]
MKVIIIGGDAAGMSAASQIKRVKPEYEVVIFERGEYISYAACGIPYYVGGSVRPLEDLLELSLEDAREKRGIDIRTGQTAMAIDPSACTVTVAHDGERLVERYDRLVIATGARPQTMKIPTGDFPNLFTMNDLYDARRISEHLAARRPRSVAVIGGGYIGLEAAESFRERGLATTLIHRREDLHRSFEKEISEMIKERLSLGGVTLNLGRSFSGVENRGDGIGVILDGEVLEFDAVLLAVGVEPNSELAGTAGIQLGANRAIRVNEYMETSIEGIYAAGDCATARMASFGIEMHAPLALKANKQGLIAGMNIAGERRRFAGIMNAAVTKVFDLGVARTGLSFDQARDLGLDPEKSMVTSRDRARYYPGSSPIHTLVITGRKDGRVLGAQMAGRVESVKRIDVFTAAIHNGMTVDQVFDLDLAYAPPFSPVYDPVLLAARVARKKR